MVDILVVSAPVSAETNMPMINAGLGAISGWLKEQGYEFDQSSLMVECQYANRNKWKKDRCDLSVFSKDRVVDFLRGNDDKRVIEEANKMGDLIDIDAYDVILVSAESDMALQNIMPMIQERCSDKLVVIGGPCTLTNNLEIVRLPYVDYGVVGDGEIPLINILEHELEGKELQSDVGLVYMKNGELVRGEPYSHPVNMKAKPFFDRETMGKQKSMSTPKDVIIPYMFGRGCTQNCSFCNYFENRKFTYKDIDKVITELGELKEEIGSTSVYFADSNVLNNPDYLKRFAIEANKRNLGVDWGGQGIIAPRDQEFFDTLSEGGCKTLMHGIESVSNSVLHRMHKAQTKTMVEDTLEKEYEAGINPVGFFMTNYIGESIEEFRETIDFFVENDHLQGASVSWFTLYENKDMPAYANSNEFEITAQKPEYEDFIDRSFEEPASYEGEDELPQQIKAFKQNYALKKAFTHVYLGNFGVRNPQILLKRSLKSLLLHKDVNAFTYLYNS